MKNLKKFQKAINIVEARLLYLWSCLIDRVIGGCDELCVKRRG